MSPVFSRLAASNVTNGTLLKSRGLKESIIYRCKLQIDTGPYVAVWCCKIKGAFFGSHRNDKTVELYAISQNK